MFGSNILDIAIGLVFAFLAVSLICTAANELIAAITRSRARDLERGIRNLLDGTSKFPLRWWQYLGHWVRFKRVPMPTEMSWGTKFFEHQLVNGTSRDGSSPSYVPSQTFATVLMHLVAQSAVASAGAARVATIDGLFNFDEIRKAIDAVPNDRIHQALVPLVERARSDLTKDISAVNKFSDQIEIWFDQAMDRVSGWYKRRTQMILFLIAIIASLLLNIDAVSIGRTLAKDSTLRASIVAAAQKVESNSPSQRDQLPQPEQGLSTQINQLQESVGQLSGLGIPMGWAGWKSPDAQPKQGADFFMDVIAHEPVQKALGLLATALAASLGAPFWFDILNMFMSVRAAGKAPEEKPKEPKEVLQPMAPASQ
jgi:hypothetical protein